MTLDLINSTPEETRQQLSELLLCADHDEAVSKIVSEVERVSKFAKQGYSIWEGTKKGREDNLSKAIKASINDLRDKEEPLDNNAIIANLWIVDAGVNEFHKIIQDIEKGRDDKESYVAWVDRRGREKATKFDSIKWRIRAINQKLQFR